MKTKDIQRLINIILKDLEYEFENLGLMRYLKTKEERDLAAELYSYCQTDLTGELASEIYHWANLNLAGSEHADSTARTIHQLARVLNVQAQGFDVDAGQVLVDALSLVVDTIVQCEVNDVRARLTDEGLSEAECTSQVEVVALRARAKAATAVMHATALVLTNG